MSNKEEIIDCIKEYNDTNEVKRREFVQECINKYELDFYEIKRNYIKTCAEAVINPSIKALQNQIDEICQIPMISEEKKKKELIQKDEMYNIYINRNIPILEKWCGYKFNKVLYDSNFEDKDMYKFQIKISGHEKLYFIVFDENNNIFGHFHGDRFRVYNSGICAINETTGAFIFTLNNNGRCGIEKFQVIEKKSRTVIGESFAYYSFFRFNYLSYSIGRISSEDTQPNSTMKSSIEGSNEPSSQNLIGKTGKFLTKRLIVLEMKSISLFS